MFAVHPAEAGICALLRSEARKAIICQVAFWGLSALARSGCCADCAVPMVNAEGPSASAMTAGPDLIDESGSHLAFSDASVFPFLSSESRTQLLYPWLSMSRMCKMQRTVYRLWLWHTAVDAFQNAAACSLWSVYAVYAERLGTSGGRYTSIYECAKIFDRVAMRYCGNWYSSCTAAGCFLKIAYNVCADGNKIKRLIV